ncbi:MAG: FtsX-like permease family protein, partial [Gallionellaceae bacterium]|nr:FtsX-like permease family protein [Gallionellaceae bacterium]
TSSRHFPASYKKSAKQYQLSVVETRTFPSMVSFGQQVLLSEIQAVEAGYPLRGKIEIDPSTSKIPQQGTVWADERLMRRLNIQVGDNIGIGALQLKVAARIVKDIDQSVGFASFAPRVLLNDQDLAATNLLQEGSRISYRLLLAGETSQIAAFRTELQKNISSNEKLEDVRDARPEIRTALERAEHFLGLAALSAAILAGAAIALASRRFVFRHLDGCAVMRCMGAQESQILKLFFFQFALLGFVAVLLGGLLGYITQALLVESIATMREADLAQPSLVPLFQAAVSGFALLIGFAFLPLLQLGKVSPLRVLRREMGAPEISAWFIYAFSILTLACLFLWHAGSLKLGLAVLTGLLIGLLIFGLLAWLLLKTFAKYAFVFRSPWKHAFNNLARHGRNASVQVVALSLGGMALLVLTLVRADLLQSWQGKLPADAPNRFIVNIQPDQSQPLIDFFAKRALLAPELLPMVRGRLIAINERTIRGDDYADPRARGLVEREFNLSYMQQMPAWNSLVSGAWWKPDSTDELSVEEGIAKTLGIHLGDKLTYDVAGNQFSARVTSLRNVQWDSMKVNFFVIATPTLLKDFPTSYLSSFYLPTEKVAVGDELSRELPNILLIDTGAVIAQIRTIMDQIAQTISAVFLFTLFSGLAVLYAAILSTQDERSQEAAILRTLGASGRYLRGLHLAEFAVLGAISGLFASGGAVLLGWALAHFVLEIQYQASLSIWFVGLLGGVLIVTVAGWLATQHIRKLPPLRILAAE